MASLNFYIATLTACSLVVSAGLLGVRLHDNPVKIKEITPLAARIDKLTTSQAELIEQTKWVDKTFLKGINTKHNQKKDYLTSFEDTLGAGVCVADFNNDGWDDIYLVTGSGNLRHFGSNIWWQDPTPNQLYINQEGLYFNNQIAKFDKPQSELGIACAVADLDKNGFADIITANKGENSVYRNIDGLHFERIEGAFDTLNHYFSTSILVRDFDGDDKEDILFGNYVNFSQDQNILELNSGFETQRNINFDASLYDPQPDTLYLNSGDWKFKYSNAYTTPNKHGRTLAFYVDKSILALNDKGSPSQVIKRHGSDPKLDNIVLNARDAKSIEIPSIPTQTAFIASDVQKGGIFAISTIESTSDFSWDYGLNNTLRLYNTWAILKADFNLDGLNDLFLSNGLITPHPDTQQTPTGQPNILLLADASRGKFNAQTFSNERILSSRGAALLDMNNDGKQDLIIGNNNDYPSLLVNESKLDKKWIGIKCLPMFMCKSINLTLNNKNYDNPFSPQISYGSQSNSSFIVALSNETNSVKISAGSNSASIKAELTKLSTYYQIDLSKKMITELTTPAPPSVASVESREELIASLRKNTVGPRLTELINIATDCPDDDKLIILDEIIASKSKAGLALSEYWARSANPIIAKKSIEALRVLEAEEAIPRLIDLLAANDAEISCAAARAFEYFFWKDEAVIERKKWAVSELVKLASSESREKVLCSIDALAESENYRALEPMLAKLHNADQQIVARSVRALGMLRQTDAVEPIKEILNKSLHPIVKAEALVALTRLNIDISTIPKETYLNQSNSIFNWILLTSLSKSSDGVNTDILNPFLAPLKKSKPPYFNLFSYDFLFELANLDLKIAQEKIKELETTYTLLARLNRLNTKHEISSLENLILFNSEALELTKAQTSKFNTSSICNTLASPQMRLNNINEKESIPSSALSKKGFVSTEIADCLRQNLNSGLYREAIQMANTFNSLDSYWLGFAQLINDNRLQTQEALFAVENFPVPTKSLKAIEQRIEMLSASDKIKFLRSAEKKIAPSEFQSWMKDIQSKQSDAALSNFINGRI